MIRRIAGDHPDPFQLPNSRLVLAAVEDIENQYRTAMSNSIDISAEPLPLEQPSEKSYSRGPSWNQTDSWQELYARINADIRSLQDPAAMQLGVPPDFDVTICMYCDTMAKKNMYQQREDYLLTLKKDEQRIAQQIFTVFKYFDELEIKGPSSVTTEMKAAKEILQQDMKLLHERVIIKLQRLVAAYQHDFLKIVNLVPLILGLDRQCQLMGLGELPVNLALNKILNADDVNNYIKKLIAQQDYARVLNIAWILSTERQFQLMGEKGIMAGNEFQQVLDFNRFQLTVSADAKEESDKHYTKGQVKSEVTYYKATPTKDCRFAFIQSNGAKSMGVGNAFIRFNLLEAASSEGVYTGNKKWIMIDPYIKIGFCSGEDTVKLFPLMPNFDDPHESWKTDLGTERLPLMTLLFSDGFDNNNNMVDAGDEMLDKMQEVQKFTADLSISL